MSPLYKPVAVVASLLACLSCVGCGRCCAGGCSRRFPRPAGGALHQYRQQRRDAAGRIATVSRDGPCPSVETGVLVYRAGAPMRIARAPRWTDTRDGIPKVIHIEVD